MANIDVPDIEYEEPCWNCFGSGKSKNIACTFCNGVGYHITRDGEKLLEFLRHRGVIPKDGAQNDPAD